MYGISKGLLGAAFIVAATSAAMADGTQTAGVQVQGSAPKTCTLGEWSKQGSSGGTITGGPNAIVTFSNAELVAADGTPLLTGFRLHAPIMCNTAMTLRVKNNKGAFSNDAAGTPPTGFSNKWGYNLTSGTVNSGGTYIYSGYFFTGIYTGQHIDLTNSIPFADAAKSTYVQIIFNLYNSPAVTSKMMAGTYSEGLTVLVAPTL